MFLITSLNEYCVIFSTIFRHLEANKVEHDFNGDEVNGIHGVTVTEKVL